jgi:antirestriction protein ArdC
MTEERRDYRQDVTNDIIRLLEEGTAPWQKPWQAGEAGRIPYNPTTNKPYRGGNIIALMVSGMRKGYTDPRWLTYKQAANQQWQVRKGESASQIEFWEVKGAGQTDDGDSDTDPQRPRLVHRVYSVFNASQINGPPAVTATPLAAWEVCEAGERILQNSGAEIIHAGERAVYNRGTDRIYLPPKELFADAPGYYGTATHELTHWTGHEKRLNRETLNKSRRCSHEDEYYAREELIAEIGSMMLAAERGIPHDPSQHAAYVASWLQALKKDKNEIFRAAANASKATDYLLALDPSKAAPLGVTAQTPATHSQQVADARVERARLR